MFDRSLSIAAECWHRFFNKTLPRPRESGFESKLFWPNCQLRPNFCKKTEGKKVEVVRALDRKPHKELWKQPWEGAISVPFFVKANGDSIGSTPAFDGEWLYLAKIREVPVYLDGETGKELWRSDFLQELKSRVPSFGCAPSPLVVDHEMFIRAQIHMPVYRWE